MIRVGLDRCSGLGSCAGQVGVRVVVWHLAGQFAGVALQVFLWSRKLDVRWFHYDQDGAWRGFP